jgi:hypothetical protein
MWHKHCRKAAVMPFVNGKAGLRLHESAPFTRG